MGIKIRQLSEKNLDELRVLHTIDPITEAAYNISFYIMGRVLCVSAAQNNILSAIPLMSRPVSVSVGENSD
jgi:hypothetical protein